MRKKGFTLMELVVVIAVIALLGMLLYPTITKYIENSEKQVCETNRRTISNMIEFEASVNQLDDPQKIIDNKDHEYFSNETICPSGGIYSVYNHIVFCSEHNRSNEFIDKILNSVEQYSNDYNTLTDSEFLAKYGFGKGLANNTNFYKYFSSYLSDSTWPEVETKIKNQLTGNQNVSLYQLPYTIYYNKNGQRKAAGYIFASTSSTLGDHSMWRAYMVYSPYTDTWYEPAVNMDNNNVSFIDISGGYNKNIEEFENWLQDTNLWKPLSK